MIFDNTVDEGVGAGACAREKGACIEFEAEEVLVLYMQSYIGFSGKLMQEILRPCLIKVR